uniref:SRCR domain-containing protein n=1 Tax=Anas zonorhyncha TaxID=75864 RepID=A0A8B9V4E8_9AVES
MALALLTVPLLMFEGAAEVRLADGGSRCAGRVEVKQQGQWGTVCGVLWDKKDAAVVCKHLGCGGALGAPQYGHFGPGSGPIWMFAVNCRGTESALSGCSHIGRGESYCAHDSDAGVICSGFVRLVRGDSPCSGSLEVYDRDQWKAVCDPHFGAKAAEVVCRELQCGTALSVHGATHLGEGASPVWDRELQCVGNESTILFCPWRAPGNEACTHGNDPYVICTRFRLVNGSTACEGRVEVAVLGTWGTLCASRWDLSDTHVLCRHLGCGFAESIPGGGHFGRGTGPIWRDSFHCDGTEAHLGQCPVTALGASPCSQENAAAVICSGECWAVLQSPFCLAEFLLSPGQARNMSVRLVGGGSRCDGRVEVFQHGTWGRVLDEQWDMQEASVVCRQLQCGEAEAAYTPVRAERGRGPVGLRGVQCAGHEADLSLCNTSLPESHPATGIAENVGVVCWEVRLADGDSRCAGRVEVKLHDEWGTVCGNFWDKDDAAVVCRQLGCGVALEAPQVSYFGPGSGLCTGRELPLHVPPSPGRAVPAAPVPWDIAASPDREKIRAVGGKEGCSGRVEIWHRGTWGTLCDNAWDMRDAEVACRQLGCGPALYALGQAAAGEGTGPMWLMECRGTELSLQDCWAQPGDSGACQHKADAAVHCSGEQWGWETWLGAWQGAGLGICRCWPEQGCPCRVGGWWWVGSSLCGAGCPSTSPGLPALSCEQPRAVVLGPVPATLPSPKGGTIQVAHAGVICQGGCLVPQPQPLNGAAPWGGEMMELVQGLHWDMTQGRKGHKGCLQMRD